VLANHEPARARVREVALETKAPTDLRVRMIALLEATDLEQLLGKKEAEPIRIAALDRRDRRSCGDRSER